MLPALTLSEDGPETALDVGRKSSRCCQALGPFWKQDPDTTASLAADFHKEIFLPMPQLEPYEEDVSPEDVKIAEALL